MGFGEKIGRGKRAKGWVLYRVEDEFALATDAYAEALLEQGDIVRGEDAYGFTDGTKRSRLVLALWTAQLKAGLVVPGDPLRTPLSQAVQDAIRSALESG